MANNEVKLRLSVDGTAAVVSDVDRVGDKLGALDSRARQAAQGADTLKTALGAMATMGTVYAMVKMADAVTTLNTQLRLASGSAAEASSAYTALFDIAQKGRVSFTDLGTTYAAIARSGKEMGVSQARLLTVTQSISQAMTIGGGSAASMQAALVQLGQGLSSGVLRGEELNSVMEQTPRLAKALADGLGIPLGELRKLGEAGKLTSEQVINALEKAGPQLAKEMESATLTVGQAFTLLTNSATNFIGVADAASGASDTLAGALKAISVGIDAAGQSIKDNETAFKFITSGLAGAATAAGLGATAIGIGAVWAAVTLGGSAAVTAALAALGTVVGLAIAAGNELSHSEGIIKLSLAKINNEIEAAEKAKNYVLVTTLKERQALLEKELQDKQKKSTAIIGSVPSPDRALEREAAKQDAKAQAELLGIRQKLSGVDANYLPTLERLNELRLAGTLGEKEYIALVSDLATKNYKKTASIKSVSAAKKELKDYDAHVLDFAKENLKTIGEEEKAREKYIATLNRNADSVGAHVQKLQDEEAALRLSAAQNISLAQALELVAIGRLHEEQAKQMSYGDEAAASAIQTEIDKRRELMGLIGSKDAREANKKAVDELEKANQKAAEESEKFWVDALMRGFESGKGFAENLRDTVVNMFKTMVLRPVIAAIVSPVGSAFAGVPGQTGSAGSAIGIAQTLKGVYDTVTGGFAALGAGVTSAVNTLAVSSTGAALGMSTAVEAMGPAIEGGLAPTVQVMTQSTATAASAMGAAATIAAGVVAGYGIGTAVSGQFGSNNTVKAGTTIGAIAGSVLGPLGTAIGAAIGGTIGGVINRAFGMGDAHSREHGIEGQFRSGSFSGNNFDVQHQDGGWFRGDRDWTDRAPVDDITTKRFSEGFAALQKASTSAAQALGLSATAIEDYSQDVRVSLTTDAEENRKIITKLFTDMGDSMANAVAPGLATFAKEGESASTTLSRLSGTLTTVNAWLGMMNHALFNLSMVGGDAATKLADAFGGLDNFTNASKAFYDSFYSDQEKIAESTEAMSKALALVGVALPSSKDAFKEAARAMDLSTDAGRQAYAVLLAIAPEFAATADLIDKVFGGAAKNQTAWQQKLDIAIGKTTQREVDKAAALLAADDATDVIINSLYAFEDAATAATEAQRVALTDLQSSTQNAITDMVTLWGDLTGAMAEINKPTAALVDQWRTSSEKLIALTTDLAAALGELPEATALDNLKAALTSLSSATAGIASLNSQIFDIKVGQGGQGAVDLLRGKEASLYAQMATSADPGAIAGQLATTTLNRIKLQGQLADKAINDAYKSQFDSATALAKLDKTNRDTQITALQKQISASQTLADVVGNLKGYIAELKFGNLSALNPGDQLSVAQSLYSSTLASAQGGDAKAMQALQGNASSYLTEAQGYYGGATSQYAGIFQSVTGALEQYSQAPVTDITLMTSQLEQLQAIADSSAALQTVTTDTSNLQIEGLTSISTALATREADLRKDAADAKQAAQAQIDELKKIVAVQEAQIRQHAAEYEVLNKKLEDIGKSLESLDNTSKQTAAAPA